MANLGPTGFDATGVEPTTDFDPLPAGKYIAEVSNSDMRPNNKGTGEYLWLEFTVLDGPYATRKVWAQLNLINPSQQAVEIAQRELLALCRAVGKLRVQDSVELHGIPLEVNVKIKNDPEYGASNVIRGYKEIGGNKSSTVPVAAPQWKQPATKTTSRQRPHRRRTQPHQPPLRWSTLPFHLGRSGNGRTSGQRITDG